MLTKQNLFKPFVCFVWCPFLISPLPLCRWTVCHTAGLCVRGVCGHASDRSPSSWLMTCSPWPKYQKDSTHQRTTKCSLAFSNTSHLQEREMTIFCHVVVEEGAGDTTRRLMCGTRNSYVLVVGQYFQVAHQRFCVFFFYILLCVHFSVR